ncbi:MAG: hypothetical protein MK226_02430 [Saprospiraceae bacterium]|nr:hypothetical protein [Saprospiraceae bacterium]
MRIFQFLITLMIFGVLSTCGNSAADQAAKEREAENVKAQEQKWDQVMSIHDEVMPLIPDINKAVKVLKENITEDIAEEKKEQIMSTIGKLESADEGMFSWMANIRQIEPLRDSMNHQEIMQYLEKEMVAVTKVKVNILLGLEEGQALITNLVQKAKED